MSSCDCACPGDTVTYECTVLSGSGGITVWEGDFFHCSSGKQLIELLHIPLTSEPEGEVFVTQMCNDGDVMGRIIRVGNNSFTSQLNVTLTSVIARNNRIECISDNGTDTHSVGLLIQNSIIG